MADLAQQLSILENKRDVKELFDTIVFSEVCSGCAACVLACPVDALDYEPDHPIVLDNCIDCQLCNRACPRMVYNELQIAQLVFDGSKPPEHHDAFGDYITIVAARSTSSEVQGVGQDGGLVTAMLIWMLEKEMIQGALVAQRFADWTGRAKLVTTKEELLACAGSLYTYVPNPLAVLEAKEQGLERVAFVGTPCEISGIRQLQTAKSKRSRDIVKSVTFTIGLMCSETFSYEGLIQQSIVERRGISLEDVTKINIKGRVVVTQRSGEEVNIPLREVRPYVREGCKFCQDFAADYADLAVGGLGKDGWTFTMLRSQKGKELFDQAMREGILEVRPAEEFEGALDLLVRLASKQRQRPARRLPDPADPPQD
ncbi:MAG: Coenzyme F420 hydrogenase/dehydrogenase, beta subunit C-terminal domain [Chloroflexi bacterium]|nr:Coenzyme F420 hydrogenase/dehydrogenase, beta subunit C-terminal domain [Chloroflexota bacterium]